MSESSAKKCPTCGNDLRKQHFSPASQPSPARSTSFSSSSAPSTPTRPSITPSTDLPEIDKANLTSYFVEQIGKGGVVRRGQFIIHDQNGSEIMKTKTDGRTGFKFKIFNPMDQQIGRISAGVMDVALKLLDQTDRLLGTIDFGDPTPPYMKLTTPQGQYEISQINHSSDGMVFDLRDQRGEFIFRAIQQSENKYRIDTTNTFDVQLLGMISISLGFYYFKRLILERESSVYHTQSQPQPVKLVDDQPYTGAAPALFKIRRKGRGSKWEIKDENKKKFFEVKNELAGLRNQRRANRLAKEANTGKIMEVTLYTLQDAQKTSIGEISVVSNYPQEGFCTARIKNSSGNNLATLQAPSKAVQYSYNLIHFPYHEREPANPELYQVETGSDSFHLVLTQEQKTMMRLKSYYISQVDILDSHDKKCLSLSSLSQRRGKFEATLYQGMSPLVANSLVVLLSTAIWPLVSSI